MKRLSLLLLDTLGIACLGVLGFAAVVLVLAAIGAAAGVCVAAFLWVVRLV